MQSLAPVCFASLAKHVRAPRPVAHRLPDTVAEALAEAMQVLCCGEESAVLAFRGLTRHPRLHQEATHCLKRMARDEMLHDCLLRDLRLSLPTARHDAQLIGALKHFYQALASQDVRHHLMQICALDSGACLIFAALRQAGTPVGNDAAVHAVVASIHKDEARHVVSSRAIVKTLVAERDFTSCMLETRARLAALLLQRGAAFETLHVDPDRLKRRLLHVPAALLA